MDDTYYPRDPNHQATPSGDLHDPHLPGEHAEGKHVHVLSVGFLATILGILLVLTFLTVAARWIDLGDFNIWLALIIAGAKALLVALYFMHLRWDSTYNTLVFATALIFLVLFIGVSMMDSAAYQVNYDPPGGAQVTSTPPAP